jgi:MFS family permease
MPIAAVLLIINGWIPHDPAYLWVAVATIFSFSLLYNVGIDPYYALLIDTTPAEHRGAVNGIAQVVGFGGNIVLLVLAAVLWEQHPDWIFYFVAAGLVIGFAVVALGVRERRDAFDYERVAEKKPRAPYLQGYRRAALGRWLSDLNQDHHEAMKLLGVKFLYEFGISAALPFLSLFIVEDVGLKGWPEFTAGVPLLGGLAGIDAAGLSQLIAAFLLLTTMISALPSGLLGDRFGKKKVFAAGLLILGAGGILASTASTIPQLLFYLTLVGLGNGARIVLYQPFLGDLIPASKAGTFTGLSAFAETGGVFLAILIAGTLLNINPLGLHYRIVFVLTGLFVLAGFIASTFVKPGAGGPPTPPGLPAAAIEADA